MILKSFQILAICTSMAVTPSNFNYDKVKKANTTTYTQNFSPEYKTTTETTISSNQKVKTRKYQATNQGDAFLVNATFYSSTYYEPSSNQTWTYTELNSYANSMLLVLQVTPYQNTVNNSLDINFTYQIESLFPDEPSLINTFKLVTKQYESTNEYWAKYVDASNINNASFNFNAIQDITNSQQGFIYTEKTYNSTLREQTNLNIISQKQNTTIYVDPNRTNYIYYYIYALYQNEDATFTKSILGNNQALFVPRDGQTTKTIEITGQIINPITGYEVVDIPGIMWEVLSMPFTFISIAFNLTLFPNTPYQVNLSNLFLSILGALIFIFIMSKFVFKK